MRPGSAPYARGRRCAGAVVCVRQTAVWRIAAASLPAVPLSKSEPCTDEASSRVRVLRPSALPSSACCHVDGTGDPWTAPPRRASSRLTKERAAPQNSQMPLSGFATPAVRRPSGHTGDLRRPCRGAGPPRGRAHLIGSVVGRSARYPSTQLLVPTVSKSVMERFMSSARNAMVPSMSRKSRSASSVESTRCAKPSSRRST
jgi:hypothetical protein